MRRRQKKGGGKIIGIVILAGLVLGAGYLYTSPNFERVIPQIIAPKSIYWNKKEPIKVSLKDNVGLKSFQLILNDGKKSVIIGKGEFPKGVKEQTLLVNYPKSQLLDPHAKELKLQVSVVDQSMWNMLQGNRQSKLIDIMVDDKRPSVEIVANSYSITEGGSALVVLQAIDENLKEVYIQTPTRKFKVEPYKKKGYYAALIAWPFNQDQFSAKVVATDMAQNRSDKHIPLYLRTHEYQVSWIKASDKFIDGKISDLASTDPEYSHIDERLKKLKAINEDMCLKNEELIHKYSNKVSGEMLDRWKVKKFYPLQNGAKVASYGDERHYYYNDRNKEVSRSYHVGYDLASTKMATIRSSNPGKVVFAGYNGIYGNMPMIDHGLGLYTLYGHCSSLLVKEGDEVRTDEAIAKTGTSGLALGDHLHFGILVQGVEVRPVEWFDEHWIKTNIDDIFAQADKVIKD